MDIVKVREYIKESNFTVVGISPHKIDLLNYILHNMNYIEVKNISNGFDPKTIIRENKISQLLDEKTNDNIDYDNTYFLIHVDSLGLGKDQKGRIEFYEDLRAICTLNNLKLILVSTIYNALGGVIEQKYSIKGGSHPIMVSDLFFYIDDQNLVKIYKNRFE